MLDFSAIRWDKKELGQIDNEIQFYINGDGLTERTGVLVNNKEKIVSKNPTLTGYLY